MSALTNIANRPEARRGRAAFAILGAVSAIALAAATPTGAASSITASFPSPTFDPPAAQPASQTAILSGGCFWGVQGVFEHVRGVKKVLACYSGGKGATARYDIVSTGTTGHAESVKIVFDPRVISYGQILRIFFAVATDPTQVNAQFPDEGPQYRSEVFYLDADQKAVAERYIAQLNADRIFHKPIATRVDPSGGFFPAETYHQDYLVRHPDAPYIATYDLPKVAALKTRFPSDYRPTPITAL